MSEPENGTSDLPPRAPAAKRALNWILWWRLDPGVMARQVAYYDRLRIWQSARGIAALCLLFTAGITIYMMSMDVPGFGDEVLIDVLIGLVIAFFIWRGSRLAMAAAMVYWTVAKGTLAAMNPNFAILLQVLWWCLYMHAFYMAYRVEEARARSATAPESVSRP